MTRELSGADLEKLLGLVKLIGDEVGHPDISLNQLKVLLYVALRDSQGDPSESREIASQLELSTSGVSRALASLGQFGRGQRRGLDLILAKADLNDRRRKPVMLTPKGRLVISKILSAL